MTALFALFANALKTVDDGLAARCFEAARRSDEHDRKTAAETADTLQWRAWALLEMASFTGEPALLARAQTALRQLLELQALEDERSEPFGMFYRDAERRSFHHKHVGADYPIWVLARFIERCPRSPQLALWTDRVRQWADGYVSAFAQRNVFGLTPYALYRKDGPLEADRLYRDLEGERCFRYFLADDPRSGGMINARLALAAVGLSQAALVLHRPELADLGYRLLGWAAGANPFQLSTVTGVGPYQIAPFSCQIGPIPGGVCNGIGGNREDLPAFEYHPWSVPCRVSEYYGYNTSQFLWALCALQQIDRGSGTVQAGAQDERS
jgi:hypothetical protein